MSGRNIRIEIPKNAEEKLTLSDLCYAKHMNDGASSPLNAMETHKWDSSGPKIAACLALHKRAEELNRQMNQAYADRDALLDEITISLKTSRDILSGIYSQNPTRLGEWGFEVHDTHHSSHTASDTPSAP